VALYPVRGVAVDEVHRLSGSLDCSHVCAFVGVVERRSDDARSSNGCSDADCENVFWRWLCCIVRDSIISCVESLILNTVAFLFVDKRNLLQL
jgi:hypothetical protein